MEGRLHRIGLIKVGSEQKILPRQAGPGPYLPGLPDRNVTPVITAGTKTVTLTYNGTTLTETIHDPDPGKTNNGKDTVPDCRFD